MTTEKVTRGESMRVLVAIDGSVPARLAVDLVSDISWPAGTEILVAEAVETGAGLFGGPWAAMPRGRPATAIVDRARGMPADLIVVGSRGHGTIESMLLGSVSAELIDHAPAPVLVSRGRRIERIVLAWDGSSGSSLAADLIRSWPIFSGSFVRVVSVADIQVPWWSGFPGPGSPELIPVYLEAADASRRRHEQLAGQMTATLQAAGVNAEADRREGDAATEILAAARVSSADVIVMGTHGRTGLARLVIGSVARNVLHHAACSVLVVREVLPDAG